MMWWRRGGSIGSLMRRRRHIPFLRLEKFDCSTKFPKLTLPSTKSRASLSRSSCGLGQFPAPFTLLQTPSYQIKNPVEPWTSSDRNRPPAVRPSRKYAASISNILSFVVHFSARLQIPSASSNLRVQTWETSSGSETSCQVRRCRCRVR